MIPPSDETRPGSSQTSVKPTLEALLRVKRAERPDAAFWTDFERGLAQKQLAAIVEPRPWWLGFALLGRRVGALGLPVSAAAAALLAVMVVRTESPRLVTPGAVEFGPSVVKISKPAFIAGAVASQNTVPHTAVVASSETSTALTGGDFSQANVGENALNEATHGKDATLAVNSTALVAAVGAQSVPVSVQVSAFDLLGKSENAAPTASQITIEQNLAAVTAEAPELMETLVATSASFASSPAPAEVDLAATLVNPRQARLLAMADLPEGGDVNAGIAQVRERMVHRLDADDSNYAAASRLGYGADRLSLRF